MWGWMPNGSLLEIKEVIAISTLICFQSKMKQLTKLRQGKNKRNTCSIYGVYTFCWLICNLMWHSFVSVFSVVSYLLSFHSVQHFFYLLWLWLLILHFYFDGVFQLSTLTWNILTCVFCYWFCTAEFSTWLSKWIHCINVINAVDITHRMEWSTEVHHSFDQWLSDVMCVE